MKGRKNMKKTLKQAISLLLTALLAISAAMAAGAVETTEEDAENYSVTLQSTTDESQVYSTSCALGDPANLVYGCLNDIPADTYTVLVYYLNVQGGNNSLCAMTEWTSDLAEGELDNIRVDYDLDTEEIAVQQIDPVPTAHYMAIVEDRATGDLVQSQNMTEAEQYDTFTALIEGLDEGNYTVSVYNMGDLVLSEEWDVVGSVTSAVQVEYYAAIDEMELLGMGPSDTDPEIAETTTASEDAAPEDAQEEASVQKNSKTVVICVVVVIAFAVLAIVLNPRKKKGKR
jgi:hypothetical protein